MEENNAFPPPKRECVHVAADHFSLAAAVYFAVSVEPLLKYVHEVSHELMEESEHPMIYHYVIWTSKVLLSQCDC